MPLTYTVERSQFDNTTKLVHRGPLGRLFLHAATNYLGSADIDPRSGRLDLSNYPDSEDKLNETISFLSRFGFVQKGEKRTFKQSITLLAILARYKWHDLKFRT